MVRKEIEGGGMGGQGGGEGGRGAERMPQGFGMINFYFMLGVSLHIDAASFTRLAPWS